MGQNHLSAPLGNAKVDMRTRAASEQTYVFDLPEYVANQAGLAKRARWPPNGNVYLVVFDVFDYVAIGDVADTACGLWAPQYQRSNRPRSEVDAVARRREATALATEVQEYTV